MPSNITAGKRVKSGEVKMKRVKILIKLLTLWEKIKSCFIKKDDYETVRSRNVKGQFVADDPNTEVNEAFVRSKRKK
jgi:hypothetical protein